MLRVPWMLWSYLLIAASAPAVAGDRPETPSLEPAGEQSREIVRTWIRPRQLAGFPSADVIGPRGLDPAQAFISVDQDPEGDMPRDVTFTADGSEAAIVHRDTDNITFFDVATQTATHTVAVGDFPVDIEATPDGRYVVVPNVLDNTVSVVDVATHTVAATIPVTGDQPFRVAVTPDSAFAVVALINDATNSAFSVIDLNTHAEVRLIPTGPQGVIGFFFSPEAGIWGNIFSCFALSPDGDTIVLPDRGGARVLLYDRATGAELADLPTAELPTAVDISPDSAVAIVSHEGAANRITEIDLVNHVVSGSVGTDESLTAQIIRITPDQTHAIAAISNNVIFVDLTTGVTTAVINTGTVGDIEISYDGKYAFVSNFNARIIDIASQTLVKTIPFAACVESAVSPVEYCAVALNNRFREDIHFYYIDGASGFFEGFASSGEPEEGDSTYGVDVSADGSVAVACNVVSRNVCIIDLHTNSIRSYVEVGERPKEVRITPDGDYAVVCAMDANAVVIIDLNTDTVVKSLLIYNRPGRVRISPDGQYAYVLNVAGTDRISFIRLDGADSYIITQLSAGQTGSANGPTYTETSGIELSDDGAILAVCDSFNDLLRLYDTATRTQVAAVTVGDFPLRVAFSPDGTRAYVTNHFSDNVSVVAVDGSNSYLLATVPGIAKYPLTVNVDATGSYVYVGTNNSGGGLNAIRVIDASTNAIVKNISFGDGYPRDAFLSQSDSMLYVGATDGRLVLVEAAGTDSTVIDSLTLSAGPADLAFCDAVKKAVLAQPPADGVDVVSYSVYGDVNSDGVVDIDDVFAVLAAWGPCDDCPEDLNKDGMVDIDDLFEVLANWT